MNLVCIIYSELEKKVSKCSETFFWCLFCYIQEGRRSIVLIVDRQGTKKLNLNQLTWKTVRKQLSATKKEKQDKTKLTYKNPSKLLRNLWTGKFLNIGCSASDLAK